MNYLPLRIIVTIFSLIGTYFFLSSLQMTEQLPEEEQKAIPLLKCIYLAARAFEVVCFWII